MYFLHPYLFIMSNDTVKNMVSSVIIFFNQFNIFNAFDASVFVFYTLYYSIIFKD